MCTGANAELWRAGSMGGRGRMGPQPQRACIQGSWRQHGLQALPPPAPLHKTADRYTVRPCIGPSSQFDYAQSCGRAACWACCVSTLLPLRVRGLNLPWTVAMDKRHQSLHHAPPMCLLRYLFRLLKGLGAAQPPALPLQLLDQSSNPHKSAYGFFL